MSNVIIQKDYYHPQYPVQPCHNKDCSINLEYKTLPTHTTEGSPWPWSYTAAAPTSMKHIYTGIPNYHPIQKISRPKNTMYGSEFQQVGDIFEKRLSYHWNVYPFTNKDVREKRVYSGQVLPYMSIGNYTKYPIIRN